MTIKQATAPTVEPVTVGELKEHLRLTHSAQDSLLADLIAAARQRAESVTARAFISSTWDATWSRFPGYCRRGQFAGRMLELPRSPLVSVEYVKYLDADGELQTFAADQYTVDTASEPGRIVLKPTADWPSLGEYPAAVQVRFVAGYGGSTDAAKRAAVPVLAKLAVKFLAAHFYANPAPVITGTIATKIPGHVAAILDQLRIHGFGHEDEELSA